MVTLLRSKLRRFLEDRLDRPTIPRALDQLSAVGFSPSGVIDVGANAGDFARLCLERWPRVPIGCIEPLESRQADLRTLVAAEPSVRVHQTLVGAAPEASVVLHESDTASSVLAEHVSNIPGRSYPMTTIDELGPLLPAPSLIKLDVQGYELAVLQGAERTLPRASVLLAEINLLDIHQGVPLMAEVIGWLSTRNWVAYDLAGMARRPLDRALWQIDLVFVPASSPLRADKRWQA